MVAMVSSIASSLLLISYPSTNIQPSPHLPLKLTQPINTVFKPSQPFPIGNRRRPICCCSPSTNEPERLFSNLNQANLKREPGSVTSAIFLVAGTTVGAGILAIPAVTQEAGFLASAVTCILCWMYMDCWLQKLMSIQCVNLGLVVSHWCLWPRKLLGILVFKLLAGHIYLYIIPYLWPMLLALQIF